MEIYHIISIIKITHFLRKAKKTGVLPVFFVARRGIEQFPLNSFKFSLEPDYERVKWQLKKPSWH